MVLEYFSIKNIRRNKGGNGDEAVKTPILNDEEEKFLHHITSEDPEGTPPPLPERPIIILDSGKEVKGKDAQIALMDGADNIPLPSSPPVDSEGKEIIGEEKDKTKEGEKKKKRNLMSYLPVIPGRSSKGKDKAQAASDLQAAAEAVKSGENQETQKKEQEDLTAILDQLNLSAVNNRVFSFSKESQELLEKFKLVLKDLINGVPTAYDDLVKLLTHSEGQLTEMYESLPPFLQTLVKSLPAKMTTSLAPELLAASSEKPQVHAARLEVPESSKSEGKKRSKRSKIPPLKTLISQQGAVATMLRTILNFLRLRFPAFVTGTNVLMSLALFLLLFVFWYCHKRGKETRLEKERLAAESAESDMERSISDLEDSAILEKPVESAGTVLADIPRESKENVTPSLITHPESSAPDKPSSAVADLPSALDLPEPASIPLPDDKAEGDEALKEAPAEAGKQ